MEKNRNLDDSYNNRVDYTQKVLITIAVTVAMATSILGIYGLREIQNIPKYYFTEDDIKNIEKIIKERGKTATEIEKSICLYIEEKRASYIELKKGNNHK